MNIRCYSNYEEIHGNYDDFPIDETEFFPNEETQKKLAAQKSTTNAPFSKKPFSTSASPSTNQQQQQQQNNAPFSLKQQETKGMSLYDLVDLEILKTISKQPFDKETADILLKPIEPRDVEIKPDGVLYLPEIKYRRILNKAFGPGGWALLPRSKATIKGNVLSRDYALFCHGRFVSQAKGDHENNVGTFVEGTAEESAKSRALMRCCKDLGIASELWDPAFINEYKSKYVAHVWGEHVTNKNRRKLWRRKDRPPFEYPYKEVSN